MVTVPNVADSRSTRGVAAGACLRKAFSFPVVLGALLVAGAVCGSRIFFAEGDTWWHIAAGQHILANRAWPNSDSYSFTVSGNTWIAYEWLAEVVMALAARLGGLPGLAVLLAGLGAIFSLLLYYYAYLRCENSKAAFVAALLLLPLEILLLSLRPQIMGYIFLLITLICLERFRRGQHKALWILPGVFLLWVNTHGTFVLGLFALGVYWISGLVGFRFKGLVAERWAKKQRRQVAVVCLLCVLVLPLTPYGTRLAAYPLEMAFLQPANLANIDEWGPVRFQASLWKMFLGFALLFFLAVVVFRPSYRLEEMVLLLFAAYAGCVHRRFAIFCGLAFVPLLAALLARWVPAYRASRDRYALNAALLVLITVALVRFFPSREQLERAVARNQPVKAVEYLREHPAPGHMLNDARWGGYLIWSLGPAHKVFIDGRGDVYEYAGVFSDYFQITRVATETPFLLQKYGVESCLIGRETPLATFLAALPDWKRVYEDELSIFVVHKAETARGVAPIPTHTATTANPSGGGAAGSTATLSDIRLLRPTS